MSTWRRTPDSVLSGIYHEVVTRALAAKLDSLRQNYDVGEVLIFEGTDIDEPLVTLVRDAMVVAIESKSGAQEKLALAGKLLGILGDDGPFSLQEVELEGRILESVQKIGGLNFSKKENRPKGSLHSSGLITNGRDESVLQYISSEFESADRIDLLCSFVKQSGLDHYRRAIERHCSQGRPMRVLTTTYMKATDAVAIEQLKRMGAEVKVSYDEKATRLHAKAWLFHRNSEYSTGYVGSSNLSHAAQTEGLEWNIRVTQSDQGGLLESMRDVFESYWHDSDSFEEFDGTVSACAKLKAALSEGERRDEFLYQYVDPQPWQRPILRDLEQARESGRHSNLVVMATGTGKTHTAAFDYRDLQRNNKTETLLFVAHRKEILEQSRRVFRSVLGRPDFGELWVDGNRPELWKHVFASVQSIAQASEVDFERYEHVILDEVHHAAASTYIQLLERLRPIELVGLTATPERADGKDLDRFFPRPFVGNMRVWDAINQQVLVPFRFFVMDTDVDLSQVAWKGSVAKGFYDDGELTDRLVSAADIWVRATVKAVKEHVARPEKIRALAFCVNKVHAQVVADRIKADLKLEARALTHDSPAAERDSAKADLASGRVQVLCVVDLFNEGVDIPYVNTLFLFRPTESATVFVQQLGRGLRRSDGKDILTIFDLTGHQHPNFRFDLQLQEFLGMSPRELREFLNQENGSLPSGCFLYLEEKSQEDILQRMRNAIPSDVGHIVSKMRSLGPKDWKLSKFLAETGMELVDLYRHSARGNTSWTSLKADSGWSVEVVPEGESAALENVHKLLHVRDSLRLGIWKKLANDVGLADEKEMRVAKMLFAVLESDFRPVDFGARLEIWSGQTVLRRELGELTEVLEAMPDSLPYNQLLDGQIPLVTHGNYLGIEISVAMDSVAMTTGKYRQFYSGVESVRDGNYDLLLTTIQKSKSTLEHHRYHDFAMDEKIFHWQSKAVTRQSDKQGRRHLDPYGMRVTPLLFVRDSEKDKRGVTSPFRFLGAVSPSNFYGERPISIEWKLDIPLPSEWLHRWKKLA